jgi:hygromycin-B 4-O-kinase
MTAVLDWGNASFGDPLYDAAWLLYFWPWHPHRSAIDIDAAIRRRWRPDPAALRAYQIHIGLDSMAYCASRDRFDDVARNADALPSTSSLPGCG